jgi:hypothetical protein
MDAQLIYDIAIVAMYKLGHKMNKIFENLTDEEHKHADRIVDLIEKAGLNHEATIHDIMNALDDEDAIAVAQMLWCKQNNMTLEELNREHIQE